MIDLAPLMMYFPVLILFSIILASGSGQSFLFFYQTLTPSISDVDQFWGLLTMGSPVNDYISPILCPILLYSTANWELCWWLSSWQYTAGQMCSLPMCILASSLGQAPSLCSALPGEACLQGDSAERAVQHCHTHLRVCHSAIIHYSPANKLLSKWCQILCSLLHWVGIWWLSIFPVSGSCSHLFVPCPSPATSPAVLPLCTSSDAACNKEVPPDYNVSQTGPSAWCVSECVQAKASVLCSTSSPLPLCDLVPFFCSVSRTREKWQFNCFHFCLYCYPGNPLSVSAV